MINIKKSLLFASLALIVGYVAAIEGERGFSMVMPEQQMSPAAYEKAHTKAGLLGGSWHHNSNLPLTSNVLPQGPGHKPTHIQHTGTRITGLNGESGTYYADMNTATIDDQGTYTDVVTRSGATTPPNTENRNLVYFATMPNPNYKRHSGYRTGGPSKTIQLWGIKPSSQAPSDQPFMSSQPTHALHKMKSSKSSHPTRVEIMGHNGLKGFYFPYTNIAFLQDNNGNMTYYAHVQSGQTRGGVARQPIQGLTNFASYSSRPKGIQPIMGAPKTELYGKQTSQAPVATFTTHVGNKKVTGTYSPITHTAHVGMQSYKDVKEIPVGSQKSPKKLKPVGTMMNPHHGSAGQFGTYELILLYGQPTAGKNSTHHVSHGAQEFSTQAPVGTTRFSTLQPEAQARTPLISTLQPGISYSS